MEFSSFSLFLHLLLISNVLLVDKCQADSKQSLCTDSLPTIAGNALEGSNYRPYVQPPGSCKLLFLAGTGVKGIEVNYKPIKHSHAGVYLEGDAIRTLSSKWQEKNETELMESIPFYLDIATGPYEKFCKVTMLQKIKGEEYAKKVSDEINMFMQTILKKFGKEDGVALQKFKDAFKGRELEIGSSILFTQHNSNSFTLAFSKDGSSPGEGEVTIENTIIGQAYVMSVMNQHADMRISLAQRVSNLFGQQFVSLDKLSTSLSSSSV